MRLNCWMKSNNEITELKSLFSRADNRVSLYFSENPDAREEHLEGHLLSTLGRETSSVYQARMNEERSLRKLPTLAIKFKHITHSEHANGADLGLVASLNIPGEVVLTKAILAQSKKLHWRGASFSQNSQYEEMFRVGSSPPQWDRLLNVTSSSVYLLFGPDRLRIDRTVKDFGTQILTAQSVKGLAESGVSRMTAAEAYSRGLNFSDWIVDQFICCNLGDSTDRVIDIARGRNKDFTVRNTLEVQIQGRNLNPSLFSPREQGEG